MPSERARHRLAVYFFALAGLLCSSASLHAQPFRLGGSVRGYQFVRLANVPEPVRRDTELWLLRLTADAAVAPRVRLEAHGLLTILSPPRLGVSRLATSDTPKFLPLELSIVDNEDVKILGSFDRLNLQFDLQNVRIIAGRQAVTWGVSYFWPSLDLFGPFPPQIVDREYKPGVDAVRCTVALGSYSELDVIGASLGPAPSNDWAGGALARIHVRSTDLGFMGGRFHGDTVLGGFFTANLRGTGAHGEVSWTESGDPEDSVRDRKRFWRGAIGFDRQLSPAVNLTGEFSWNGYGTSDTTKYLEFLNADRIQRGEVNALGRHYAGAAVNWQLHPLWTLSNTLLVNLNDASVLLVPSLAWSTGNNSEVLFGAQIGMGRSFDPGGVPRSEYGSAPHTLFAGFTMYF